MKRVADYLNYADFKSEADQKVLPVIQKIVDECFKTPLYDKYKKSIKLFYIVGLVTLGLLAITLSILIPCAIYNKTAGMVVSAIIGTFTLVSLILTMIYLGKSLSAAKGISSMIRKKASKDEIYKMTINILQPNWNFQGTNYNDPSAGVKYSFAPDTHVFTMSEYKNCMPSNIPNGARLVNANPCQTLIIDGKYPAHFSNTHWIYETTYTDSKGNVHHSETHYYATLLKIDARSLDQKHWARFSFFDSFMGKMKKIKLENPEFNKIFKLKADDELKARVMFTPLAMENLTNMWKKNLKFTNTSYIKLQADNDLIYMGFISPQGFGVIDVPLYSTKPEKVTKAVYNDILKDIFSLYFLLELVYIPNYLY
ncbi:DUF3137 domain-containing protein [Mycoplasma sp. VS299A]|uniref:DUF3137 domain-containing protein n=1 Tax=unclassified Mycoplasma TaxID=2683645 RepID=UPI003A8A53DE